MEKNVQRENLKEKFSKVEIAFDDDSMDYKISGESLKKIQTHSQNARSKSLMGVLWRGVKHLSSVTADAAGVFYRSVIRNSLVHGWRMISAISEKARNKSEQVEVYLDQTITHAELVKKEKEALREEKKQVQTRMAGIYSEDIQDYFGGRVGGHSIAFHSLDNGQLKKVLSFQAENFHFVSKKLLASNMISNIKSMNIVTKEAGQGEVATEILFELQKKGYLWSSIFAKHFVPELKSRLEKKDGKISVVHHFNMTKNLDVFRLNMSFNSHPVLNEKRSADLPSPKINISTLEQ